MGTVREKVDRLNPDGTVYCTNTYVYKTKEKMNKKLAALVNGFQDAVTNDTTQKISKLANGALGIAAQIGQAKLGGPLAIAGAVVGSLHVIQESFELERESKVNRWHLEHGLNRAVRSGLPKLLMTTGAAERVGFKRLFSEGACTIYGLEHKGKLFTMLLLGTDGVFDPSPFIRMNDGFDLSVLRDAVWDGLGKPIAKMVMTLEKNEWVTTFELSDYGDQLYLGKHSPRKFAEKITKYRARGISRAAVLSGPPGSGKTTFVRTYAREIGGRVLAVTPGFFGSICYADIATYAQLLQPEVLLFDDIDHVKNGLESALNIVDDLRRTLPNTTIITTCNDLISDLDETKAALLRPGRLGEFLEMLAPNDADKIELLQNYMETYCEPGRANDFDLALLIKGMVHKRFTHDYVRFVAEQAVLMDQEELIAYIAVLNRYLTVVGNKLEQPQAAYGKATPAPVAAGNSNIS